MQEHLRGFMLSTWHYLLWKRQPFTITQPSQKHRNKGYFDQNNTVLIPNVTQFVQKTYIIANKVQKFQLKLIDKTICLISCVTQKN